MQDLPRKLQVLAQRRQVGAREVANRAVDALLDLGLALLDVLLVIEDLQVGVAARPRRIALT
jgi:hypothetical protein